MPGAPGPPPNATAFWTPNGTIAVISEQQEQVGHGCREGERDQPTAADERERDPRLGGRECARQAAPASTAAAVARGNGGGGDSRACRALRARRRRAAHGRARRAPPR